MNPSHIYGAAIIALLGGACPAYAQVSPGLTTGTRFPLEGAGELDPAISTRRLPPIDEPRSSIPAADVDAILDRLKALEEAEQKRADAAAKELVDASLEPTQQWTGRIHADYWAFPNTSPGANAFENDDSDLNVEDRFLFRRIRLGIQGDIADNMLYKSEVDFNNPESPQLKDVYLGWEELPLLQTVQIGNQKRPYGLDHINSSRYNIFIERPEIIEAFNQDARRFGVCSYGVSEDLAYNWRLGAYMGRDMQNVGIVLATPVAERYQAEIAGRLANTFWYDEASDGRGWAHFGIAGTLANTDGDADANVSTARFQTRPEARTQSRWFDTGVIAGAETYQLGAVEGVFNYGPTQLVGEFQHVWMQRDSGQDLSFCGAYGYISYFLTGEHMAWDRTTGQLARTQPFQNFFLVDTCDDGVEAGWGAWQVALRYSYVDFNDDDIAGGVGHEVTAGLDWLWNPYAKMQFNLIYGEIADRRPEDGQTDAHFTILGTRMQVDF